MLRRPGTRVMGFGLYISGVIGVETDMSTKLDVYPKAVRSTLTSAGKGVAGRFIGLAEVRGGSANWRNEAVEILLLMELVD